MTAQRHLLTVQNKAALTLNRLALAHDVDEGQVVARGLALLEAAEGKRLAFVKENHNVEGGHNGVVFVDPWPSAPTA